VKEEDQAGNEHKPGGKIGQHQRLVMLQNFTNNGMDGEIRGGKNYFISSIWRARLMAAVMRRW
jgi:hypothetical protein